MGHHHPEFFTWADALLNTSGLNVSFDPAQLGGTPGQIWDFKAKINQIYFYSLFSVQGVQTMLLYHFPSWISMVI